MAKIKLYDNSEISNWTYFYKKKIKGDESIL